MTDPQHRERIRRSFDRAEGYDGAATLQRLAAHNLTARLVRALDGRKPTRILEIGCGTGLLTELLARNWPEAQIVATDFAPQMLERASRRAIPRTEFKFMDAANPTVEGPFDVVCGNLVMQWLEQPEPVMERLGGVLAGSEAGGGGEGCGGGGFGWGAAERGGGVAGRVGAWVRVGGEWRGVRGWLAAVAGGRAVVRWGEDAPAMSLAGVMWPGTAAAMLMP